MDAREVTDLLGGTWEGACGLFPPPPQGHIYYKTPV